MIKTTILRNKYKKYIILPKSVIIHINEKYIDEFVTVDEFSVRIFNTNDKGRIVSAIVKAKYSQDEMDAVRNNYELVRDGTAGDKTEIYIREYNTMQEWRAEAKEIANSIINEITKD